MHFKTAETKTKAKHTPGPWKAERLEWGDYRITYNDAGNWLADVYCDGDRDEEAAADARLIAAAPELLEAARALLACDTAENWLTLREAVAKAEGR